MKTIRIAGALLATIAFAQVFDVATVRVAGPQEGERAGRARIVTGPEGITARGATLLDCIAWAWEVREYQVAGPDALRNQQYDIRAKAGHPATPAEMRPMLRALLQERFGLMLHREKRPMPALALVAAKNGTKLGQAVTTGGGEWKRVGPGLRLEFRAQTMADLAAFLSTLAVIDRPVVDGTGLDSAYTFVLDLNEAVRPGDNTAPSVSTLLQEQLGVRLEAGDCHWR